MANQIGTFNGRTLASDKPVQSVVNLRVNFVDGSWVDMASGEKYVRGHDDIIINPPFSGDAATEETTFGPKTYDARHLDVRNVANCAVVVDPHDSDTVIVTVSGNKTTVDEVTVRQDGDTIIIAGPEQQMSGGITISGGNIRIGGSSRGSVISASGISIGGMSISGGNSTPQATITVKVPKGAKVTLGGEWHSANIGDTDGNLSVTASGSGDVKAGRVKNTSIAIKGSSDVTLREVNGNASIRIMGSGDVRINGGSINTLNADVMGSGDVTVHTQTEEADLSIMGSGDIYVSSVKNRPSKSVMGTGSIKVGNW